MNLLSSSCCERFSITEIGWCIRVSFVTCQRINLYLLYSEPILVTLGNLFLCSSFPFLCGSLTHPVYMSIDTEMIKEPVNWSSGSSHYVLLLIHNVPIYNSWPWPRWVHWTVYHNNDFLALFENVHTVNVPGNRTYTTHYTAFPDALTDYFIKSRTPALWRSCKAWHNDNDIFWTIYLLTCSTSFTRDIRLATWRVARVSVH